MRYQFHSPQLDPAETVVPQYETFNLATQECLRQLRTLCDSILYTYLSTVAYTPEKKKYLHAMCTIANALRNQIKVTPPLLTHLFEVFALYPPTFQPSEDLRFDARLLGNSTTLSFVTVLPDYFRNFLRNPERSRLFHYDPIQWNTFVATCYTRSLRTGSILR